MIKIIQHGELAKRNPYEATCHSCGCIFSYEGQDTITFDNKEDGGFIYCPECGHRMVALCYTFDCQDEKNAV